MISHPITREDIRAIYAAEVAHLDASHAVTPESLPLPLLAWRGTRTRVHEIIHQQYAPEPARAEDHDDEDHHIVVKAHNKRIWREVDHIIAEAGITAEGAS